MAIEASRSLEVGRRRFAAFYDEILNPSDRILLSVLFCMLFWNQCGRAIVFPAADEPVFSTFRAAEFLGFAAIGVALRSMNAARSSGGWDLVAITASAAALVTFSQPIGSLVLTLLAVRFAAARDRELAAIALLCAGMAWIDFWGPIAMGFLAPWLLPLETALGFRLAQLFGPVSQWGNAIVADNGHRIIVAPECSSFGNTVRTSFIWLALLKMQGLEPTGRHLRVLLFALSGVVAVNTLRLALMAQNEAAYRYWHFGMGSAIASVFVLCFVLGLFYRELRPDPGRAG